MSMTPNAPSVNAPEIVTPYRKEGDRLTPILTPTDASLVSYENTSPEAEFKGTNMKEALDTLFDRMPAIAGNGRLLYRISYKVDINTSRTWVVPTGVYELLCLVLSPGRWGAQTYPDWISGGTAVSFYTPVTPGTSMTLKLGRVPRTKSETDTHAMFYVTNNTKVGCFAYAPYSRKISYNLTFPGAEQIFYTKGGDGYIRSASSYYEGGGFRIKDEDLIDFALYGGTSKYKTPTNSTTSAKGTHVWGPSGAASYIIHSLDGYCASSPNSTAGVYTDMGLVALFWGPQIHV